MLVNVHNKDKNNNNQFNNKYNNNKWAMNNSIKKNFLLTMLDVEIFNVQMNLIFA